MVSDRLYSVPWTHRVHEPEPLPAQPVTKHYCLCNERDALMRRTARSQFVNAYRCRRRMLASVRIPPDAGLVNVDFQVELQLHTPDGTISYRRLAS
jgi:hypothetical protein